MRLQQSDSRKHRGSADSGIHTRTRAQHVARILLETRIGIRGGVGGGSARGSGALVGRSGRAARTARVSTLHAACDAQDRWAWRRMPLTMIPLQARRVEEWALCSALLPTRSRFLRVLVHMEQQHTRLGNAIMCALINSLNAVVVLHG
jgi:hypothetical protein